MKHFLKYLAYCICKPIIWLMGAQYRILKNPILLISSKKKPLRVLVVFGYLNGQILTYYFKNRKFVDINIKQNIPAYYDKIDTSNEPGKSLLEEYLDQL